MWQYDIVKTTKCGCVNTMMKDLGDHKKNYWGIWVISYILGQEKKTSEN